MATDLRQKSCSLDNLMPQPAPQVSKFCKIRRH